MKVVPFIITSPSAYTYATGNVVDVVQYFLSFLFSVQQTDGVFLATCAALLAGASVLVGHRLKLDVSAKLFTITLLLVTFAGDAGKETWKIAAIRVGGIVVGVLLALLLSVVILPKSASIECLHCIDNALSALHDLFSIVWKDFIPVHSSECSNDSNTASLAHARGITQGEEGDQMLLLQTSTDDSLEDGENGDDEKRCEEHLTRLYNALFELQSNIKCAKSEWLAGKFAGGLVFVPGPPFGRYQVHHMPWDALQLAAMDIRRAAGVLFALRQALLSMDGSHIREVSGRCSMERILLKNIASSGEELLSQVQNAFPWSRMLSSKPVVQLLHAIDAWETAGGENLKAQLRSSRKYLAAQEATAGLARVAEQRALSEGEMEPAKTNCPQQELDSNNKRSENNQGVASSEASSKVAMLQRMDTREVVALTIEWHNLGFLLRQVGLELAQLHHDVLTIMDRLPTGG